MLIDRQNDARSLGVAARTRFLSLGDLDGHPYFTRPVPPLRYTDGVINLRRRELGDIDADLAAKDGEQMRWLWLPGQREAWEAMSARARRAYSLDVLRLDHDNFGRGPKWAFSIDTNDAATIGYVDCDLANANVPAGDANISYAVHPDHRGRGYARRAVRLIVQFLADHTGAREAHVIVDAENIASMRVAAAAGATVSERFTNDLGRRIVRHVRLV